MRLSFYGAAGEVTGSCYLVETSRARVMVDFGLHQGRFDAEKRNRRLPPIDFARLDAVVLTHAHLDHAGRMPLLTKAIPSGRPLNATARVWATPATIGLTDILLKDTAALMAADTERECDRRRRMCRPLTEPLYGMEEVERLMPRLSPISYDQPRQIADGITVRMVDAGHIIGSASVEMTVEEPGAERKVIAFSADIGEKGVPLLRDPTPIPRCDVMLLESTYGDRDHKPLGPTIDEFTAILVSAREDGAKVLIPAFAVGRTQQLVYHMGDLFRNHQLLPEQVFVDSPMALSATDLYRAHKDLWDEAATAILDHGGGPLSFPGLHYTRSSDESRALNTMHGAAVIIAASGMCTGGRILHHLKHQAWKPETRIIFVGYQAEGTLGRRIVDGQKMVRIMDDTVAVKAQVHTLGGFSAHAGQTGLVEWASAAKDARPRLFLTHGEDGPRAALRDRLDRDLGMKAELPVWGQAVEL